MTAPISASLMPVAEISWREDLMSMPHCDTRSYPRQYDSVFARPHTSSYRPVMDMRSLLKALMALRDENAYALEERSGVPQATINRFLTGKHGDPRSTTVRKWAGAYNLTESQLRGDAPLPDALMREIVRTAPEYADALLPSSPGESAENPSDSARIQPAKKAMESGAPLVLSPAVHALIETVRPLPDDDLALLTQIARRMARGGIGEKTRRLIESDGQDAGLEGLLSTQAITRNKKTPI